VLLNDKATWLMSESHGLHIKQKKKTTMTMITMTKHQITSRHVSMEQCAH